VRWNRLLGRIVICDRYVEDALLDLRLRFPELGTDRWRLAGLLRALAPRPDVRVLLRIPHGEMLRRMEVKAEPFPDAPEIREQRFAAYQEFVKRGYQAVDGARSVDVVHGAILKLVTARDAPP
jgi:thymidylate kinase